MNSQRSSSGISVGYAAPSSLDELVRIYEQDPEANVLIAGGQSLLPDIFSNKTSPRLVLDIRRVPELCRLDLESTKMFLGAGITLGGLLTAGIAVHLPTMATALNHVGNVTIRNASTVGGSLAWANPRGEFLLMCLLYGALIYTNQRKISIQTFIQGPLKSALAPGEIILGVELEHPGAESKGAFLEIMPRQSTGIAIVSVGLLCKADDIYLAVGGLVDRPVLSPVLRSDEIVEWLQSLPDQYPYLADKVYSASYRQSVAATLALRACKEAGK